MTNIEQLLEERILTIAGPMGTNLQKLGLSEEDFRGDLFTNHPSSLRGNNDLLNLTRPDVVLNLQTAFLKAGADILETNTFNANRISMSDYRLEDTVADINTAAVKLAKQAAGAVQPSRPNRPIFIAGTMGPTNKQLSIASRVDDPAYRDKSFDDFVDVFTEQAKALIEAGVDIILCETSFDTLVLKASLFALDRYFANGGRRVPVMASMSINKKGRSLSGQTIEASWNAISQANLLSVGFNCSLGPDMMTPHLEELSKICSGYVSAHPNAGLPDSSTPPHYPETPESMGRMLNDWAQRGLVNIAGGCCGNTPDHIQAIAESVQGITPRKRPAPANELRLSGLYALNIPEGSELNIGNACDSTQAHDFTAYIAEGDYESAVELARRELEDGAQIVHVNMDIGGIDQVKAITDFLNYAISDPFVARRPFMISSRSWNTLEAGLKCLTGKGIAKGITLKNGHEEFIRQAHLALRYGVAFFISEDDDDYETAKDILIHQVGYKECDIARI